MRQREALLKSKEFVAHWIEPWEGGPWPCVELITDDVALLALPHAGTVTDPVTVCGQESRRRATCWPREEIPWTIYMPAGEDKFLRAFAALAPYIGARDRKGAIGVHITAGPDGCGAALKMRGWNGEATIQRPDWRFDPWPQERPDVVLDAARLGMLLPPGHAQIRVPADSGRPVLILPADGTYQAILMPVIGE